jgi:hypothetical protein
MTAFIGKIKYVMEEDVFADALDIEDAEYKMQEAFMEDFPEATSIEVFDIEEVKKK